jgi:hypothetical protein
LRSWSCDCGEGTPCYLETMSASRPLTASHDDHLEPLTAEQRAAVNTSSDVGMVDSPQVAALRKQARGEPLTDEEKALLAAVPGRKPAAPGVPVDGDVVHVDRIRRA